jgi:hypothetical protein
MAAPQNWSKLYDALPGHPKFVRAGYKAGWLYICGQSAPDVKLQIDHVIPEALGGRDDPSNLVTACRDCNAGKSSTAAGDAVVDDVEQKALAWGNDMRWALEEQRQVKRLVEDLCSQFSNSWEKWTITGTDQTMLRPDDWERSLQIWLRAGVTVDDLDGYITIAMKSKASHEDKWRYLCGVVWKALDRATETAMEIVTQESPPWLGEPYTGQQEIVA